MINTQIVYILISNKLNRFYIGYTSNIDARLEFHLNSPSNKFTSNAKDWVLFYSLECESKQQALKIIGKLINSLETISSRAKVNKGNFSSIDLFNDVLSEKNIPIFELLRLSNK